MDVTVVGTGYVGLVAGTCLANGGHRVMCVDIDEAKIERLRAGILPIYEPGLDALVLKNQAAGRLSFTTDLAAAVNAAPIVVIGVGTPGEETGRPDLRALWSVVDGVCRHARESKIVVVKSTVPVGTNALVQARLDEADIEHYAASNPEFLREGCAVGDFLHPDRVVIGVRNQYSEALLSEMYAPFVSESRPLVVTTPESAEMCKYAANAFLATKISFINEVANLCERLGADVDEVRRARGLDHRIGFQFLRPGAGYGGSCFPKDVAAMIAIGEMHGYSPTMLEAVRDVNRAQKRTVFEKLEQEFSDLAGKRIAIWGLAFKPGTDDLREAPALTLIDDLLAAGAEVQVHDPVAMENAQRQYPRDVVFCESPLATVEGADALAIMTEWEDYQTPDFGALARQMSGRLIVDGRNLYDREKLRQLGFDYLSVGRPAVYAATTVQAVSSAVA